MDKITKEIMIVRGAETAAKMFEKGVLFVPMPVCADDDYLAMLEEMEERTNKAVAEMLATGEGRGMN